MQLTAFFLLIFSLTLSARTSSQTVSILARDMPLSSLLNEVKSQTGFFLMTDDKSFQGSEKVSVEGKNMELKAFLELVLKNLPYDFEIRSKTIFIKTKPADPATDLSPRLPISPPPITVRGRIVNESGEPVIASVTIKGTGKGTTTNANGEFTLKNLDGNAVLEISSVGYKNKEILVEQFPLKGEVELLQSDSKLDEVQIIAYGTKSNRLNITSVSTVKAKDIQNQPVLNPLQAIQGRMPGVYISNYSGMPGAAISISIRGRNSLRNSISDNGNEVLYIIDGVQYPSKTNYSRSFSDFNTNYGNILSTIDPNDIESIDILKDAGATSIYGSQGANGVILITTKRAKNSALKIDMNVNQGFARVPKTLTLLNNDRYTEMRKEALTNDGVAAQVDDISLPGYAPDLLIWSQDKNTNWQNELLGGTARRTSAQASVSMGGNGLKFLISGNYIRQGNVFGTEDTYWRGTGRFNLNYTSKNNKFLLDYSSSYGYENNKVPTDVTRDALILPPNMPDFRYPDGSLIWNNEAYLLGFLNPYSYRYILNENQNTDFANNLQFSIQLFKSLRFKTSASYFTKTLNKITANKIESYPPQYGITTGDAFWQDGKNINWSVDPQLIFEKKSRLGFFTSLVGTSLQQNTSELLTRSATGFLDDISLQNPAAAPTSAIAEYSKIVYRYNRIFARLSYDFNGKYLFETNLSRDGSTRFGANNKFGNFYSFAGGWIFSNEDFMKQSFSLISFGKLRASVGTTGNDKIPDYQYLNSFLYQSSSYGGIRGMIPARIANDNFQWEITRKLDLALDIGILNDKLLFSFNWFKNRSSNQLVGLPLPRISGFNSIVYNLNAVVENKGLELSVNSVNIQNKSLTWSTNFNITFPKNMLISYPGLQLSTNRNIYEIGKSINHSKQYLYIGVNPNTGEYSFEDPNKDGEYDFETEAAFYKELAQKTFGGLSNNVKYKNVELNFLFQFVKQTVLDYRSVVNSPGLWYNQPDKVMARWRNPGDITDVQRFSQDYVNSVAAAFDRFKYSGTGSITDGSFIKLRNVAFAYYMPKWICKKINASNFKVFLQGQNLITWTPYVGLDPETNYFALPQLRTFNAGLQITFN